ncbi:sensor histidine kinase [Persicimonas caeni]|uniref:sensor histidine kinase n=1 Tax=Persicimonas caeni TaxID=2292766 RepID=UPI00143D9652|nr:PAS domain-containing protein [Persicimonas caeni]
MSAQSVAGQTVKGLVFVGITSALLFFLIGSQRAKRKRLIGELQETQRRYEAAERIGRIGHWEYDVTDGTLSWSPHVPRLFQLDPTRTTGLMDRFYDRLHPDDVDFVQERLESSLETGEEFDTDYRIMFEDGEIRWFHANAKVENGDDGEPRWLRGTVQDVTERVQLDRQHQQATQRIQRLMRAVTVAQEEERERIAREIHDELGQTLTGLTFGLRALKEHADGSATELIDQMAAEVKEATVTIGKLASSLRPPLLDQFGLIAALEQLCREASERYNIECDFEEQGTENWRVNPNVAIQVFRVAQEALTNVARHAEAHHATVCFETGAGSGQMLVRDDGKGFDPERTVQRSSFGIQGMRERAALIGGKLQIDSSSQGTTVRLELPLEEN